MVTISDTVRSTLGRFEAQFTVTISD